jgi:alanyl-tRNA synthetase
LEIESRDSFSGGPIALILDRTNFYPEMGGQVGDSGDLRSGENTFEVQTALRVGGYVLHVGRVSSGVVWRGGSDVGFRLGDTVSATVAAAREFTEKNHTTTHLANWALREVLGDAVQQKGSLVDPEKLRFDFSHGKALTEDELARVEDLVNRSIEGKVPVYTQVVPQEQALKINGLRAVFGEKYPPMVRVVSIGAPVSDLIAHPENPKWREFSIEFCGGTHLRDTGEAVTFVITGEESVSKGIRRIIAVTGDAALAMLAQGKSAESLIELARKKPDGDLAGIITALQKSIASGELALRSKRRAQAALAELQDRYRKWEKSNKAESSGPKIHIGEIVTTLFLGAKPLSGGQLIVGEVPAVTADQLLSVTDVLKRKVHSYAILLGSADNGKVNFVAAVSDDLIAKGLKAGDWIREAAKATGGGGGGRPQLAQAGGKDPAKLPEALRIASDYALRTAIRE